MNTTTGQVKKIALASDKQFQYLQSLRSKFGKEPLKNRPTVFAANKAIDKLVERDRQTKLL